jgi:hypothetical protein
MTYLASVAANFESFLCYSQAKCAHLIIKLTSLGRTRCRPVESAIRG